MQTFADPLAGQRDFFNRIGGFLGPHLDQKRAGVAQIVQRFEAIDEIDAAFAERNIAEGAREAGPDRPRLLDMDADDLIDSRPQFGGDIVAPRSEIAKIRIDHEPRRRQSLLEHQILADRVEKSSIHDLQRQRHLMLRSDLQRALHPFVVALARLPRRWFVIDVVAGKLDDADSGIAGKLNGLGHELRRLRADRRIGAAERDLAMPRQTHRRHRHLVLARGAEECQSLGQRPVEASHSLGRLVDRQFEEIIAAVTGSLEPLGPAQILGQSLFIDTNRIFHQTLSLWGLQFNFGGRKCKERKVQTDR